MLPWKPRIIPLKWYFLRIVQHFTNMHYKYFAKYIIEPLAMLHLSILYAYMFPYHPYFSLFFPFLSAIIERVWQQGSGTGTASYLSTHESWKPYTQYIHICFSKESFATVLHAIEI